jgi:hypothetical protein
MLGLESSEQLFYLWRKCSHCHGLFPRAVTDLSCLGAENDFEETTGTVWSAWVRLLVSLYFLKRRTSANKSRTGICAAIKTSKLMSLNERSDFTWETFSLFMWTGYVDCFETF